MKEDIRERLRRTRVVEPRRCVDARTVEDRHLSILPHEEPQIPAVRRAECVCRSSPAEKLLVGRHSGSVRARFEEVTVAVGMPVS